MDSLLGVVMVIMALVGLALCLLGWHWGEQDQSRRHREPVRSRPPSDPDLPNS